MRGRIVVDEGLRFATLLCSNPQVLSVTLGPGLTPRPDLALLVSEGSVGEGGISLSDNKGTQERIDKSKYLFISAE